ncbi:hypothetical protein [Halobacteriovorax marinus]|uniref:hypothetical protein n=1 Tax=Halobacteriovorax marinus TaxID=97084 RepID=UPI0012FEF16F|nr:hypothetical protein [Halobacteriovorax marinus]
MASAIFKKSEIETLFEKLDLINENNSGLLFFNLNDEPIAWSLGTDIFDTSFRLIMYIVGKNILSLEDGEIIGQLSDNRVLDINGKVLYTLIQV